MILNMPLGHLCGLETYWLILKCINTEIKWMYMVSNSPSLSRTNLYFVFESVQVSAMLPSCFCFWHCLGCWNQMALDCGRLNKKAGISYSTHSLKSFVSAVTMRKGMILNMSLERLCELNT